MGSIGIIDEDQMKMNGPVVVTGAAGYVGSWLVMRLLQLGYTVRATVRDPSSGLLLLLYTFLVFTTTVSQFLKITSSIIFFWKIIHYVSLFMFMF